jgi:hypothetical protein
LGGNALALKAGAQPELAPHVKGAVATVPKLLLLRRFLVFSPRPDRDALLKSIHDLVDKAGVVKPDWNGYNVIHDNASRVAALDLNFAPSAAAKSAPPAKMVFLLGADDWKEEEVPKDAFVVYQVCWGGGHPGVVLC